LFVLHAAEGYDEVSAEEIFELDRLGMLSPRTILVHALALRQEGIALINRRGASVVWCPTSNQFLFGRTHGHDSLISLDNVVLGSDSPLTAAGDLLDEVRFAHGMAKVDAASVFRMISDGAARVLRLRSGEGTLRPGAVADLFAVRDTGEHPACRLVSLSHADVELVIIGGRVQLSSPEIFERLPSELRKGLQPVEVGGHLRWVRAEVGILVGAAKNALGPDVRLGKKLVRYACSA
jgi:cytosine/adenosine deaminase-related metal-dependent hydrolase